MVPAHASAAQSDCTEHRSPPFPYDPFIIFFDWDSAAITPQGATTLDNVSRAYSALPNCGIHITAHTDRTGSADYNLTLSRRRTAAVAAYLRRRGIRSRFVLEGYGETRPLVEASDGVHEPQNRRAEILLIPPLNSR